MSAIVESPYGNIDRGVLQAIGLAVVNYSLLEESLALGVAWLIAGKLSDDVAHLVVRKLSFRVLLDTFGGLYRHRFPDDLDSVDLKEICKELEALNEERNRMFHSFLTLGKAAGRLNRYQTTVVRRGRKILDDSLSEAEILGFAERAEKESNRFLEFVGQCILPRIDDVIPKGRS